MAIYREELSYKLMKLEHGSENQLLIINKNQEKIIFSAQGAKGNLLIKILFLMLTFFPKILLTGLLSSL